MTSFDRIPLYRFVFLLSPLLRAVLLQSLACAFLSGAIGSVVFHVLRWESFKDPDPTAFDQNVALTASDTWAFALGILALAVKELTVQRSVD